MQIACLIQRPPTTAFPGQYFIPIRLKLVANPAQESAFAKIGMNIKPIYQESSWQGNFCTFSMATSGRVDPPIP